MLPESGEYAWRSDVAAERVPEEPRGRSSPHEVGGLVLLQARLQASRSNVRSFRHHGENRRADYSPHRGELRQTRSTGKISGCAGVGCDSETTERPALPFARRILPPHR